VESFFLHCASHLHLWSELFAPLVNMVKDGCQNKSVYPYDVLFKTFDNLTFH